ncbi:hypothetical protein ACFU7Y_05200 [Kitasatospora sp. NPDC057542]|uniref:hypothetical protein n=1 Tax=Kitasatospora sp. NPDC057542 TaxID=3346162 RepID=UPI0036B23896
MGQPSTAALVAALFLTGALMVAAALGESRPSAKRPRRSPDRHVLAVPITVAQVV